ncbi:hypothetical protein HDU76_011971 [Blyttiomyces sp. JEL0837]|nr:hypothetical protein HDU76_011971 [Blyttiomyces sp. JEL0837]
MAIPIRIMIVLSIILLAIVINISKAQPLPFSVTYNSSSFIIDGTPRLLRGGTIQWARMAPELWRDRVAKFAAMGYNTVDVYVAWRDHEPVEGQFDFQTKDVKKFLEICKEFKLWVYLRPGPYITNELDGGGVPQWVLTKTSKKVRDPNNADGLLNMRTNDKDYIDATKKYFTALMAQVKPFLHTNGGPIILVGIENELTWGAEFFEIDKWSKLPDGTWERPDDQTMDIPGYLSQLRDIMTNLGVDVPITTCPGDGTVSATGDVPGIIPMPNMYRNIPGLFTLPYSAWSILEDMHNPSHHNGVYVNMPSGTTETARDTNTLRTIIMAGFDAVFQFNQIAFHQEGYQNAILANSGDVASFAQGEQFFAKFTDFTSPEAWQDFFVRPPIGYFGNVLDYVSAYSPSGVMREKYHQIRRTNLFFNDFEAMIAAVGSAKRSVYRIVPGWLTGKGNNHAGADTGVMIQNKRVGSPDPDIVGERANYYLEVGRQSAFISVYNDGVKEDAIYLDPETIQAYGVSFPQFTTLTVPIENASSSQESDSHRRYTMILPVNIPLPTGSLTITYSTSEILVSRPNWGPSSSLLVIYGSRCSMSEIAFKNATLISSDAEVTSHGIVDGNLIVSYTHEANPWTFTVAAANGQQTQVVVVDTYLAGKCWFPKLGGNMGASYAMICGLDYLDENGTSKLPAEIPTSATIPFYLFAPPGTSGYTFNIGGDQSWKVTPGSAQLMQYISPGRPNAYIQLTKGSTKRDDAEASALYDDSKWIQLGNQPKALEYLGMATGHSWYRARFNISADMLSSRSFVPKLYVPFASDFVGIYLNGNYLTTVNPIGTEIDSDSNDLKYQFDISPMYLKPGLNTLAFRVEVWGHGSFVFFRGSLARVKLAGIYIDLPGILSEGKIPSLGFDSLKGLQGNVSFSGIPVQGWTVQNGTAGERSGFMNNGFDSSSWEVKAIPYTFGAGEVVWFRWSFDTGLLPPASQWNGPLNLRLQGQNAKATIYLNGRLIGRWISDSCWMRRGTWARPMRGPWSVADEDETPIEASMLNTDGTLNILSIQFEDAATLESTASRLALGKDCFVSPVCRAASKNKTLETLDVGIIKSVTMLWSSNEERFTKKDGDGNVLSPVAMRIPVQLS